MKTRKRIEDLFEAAIERPAEERERWLAEACDDPAVRSEVSLLLAAHSRVEGVLDRPVPGFGITTGEERATGTQVGPYELVKPIGRGGMGVVYQARDPRLDRFVALKFLSAELRADVSAKERFLAEARAASALDHRNICTIHDVGETDDGGLWIAMPHYEGRTLDAVIADGPLPIDECLELAQQAADGLEAAHDAGIVHRDVKPANLLVTGRGELKILDFGIAKLADNPTWTTPGLLVGTVAYMSPEQARGERVDARTDLWSLGVVIWEMLAGRRPFRGESAAEILDAVLTGDPEPLSEARPDAPGALEIVLRTALAKAADDRYGSAGELRADLAAVRAARPITARPRPTAAPPLPAPLSTFVGRERERREVESLLARVRLLTFTGPGGTGKTRLSLQTAYAMQEEFADGVHFVPLGPIGDPELVPSAIAQALGVVESGTQPMRHVIQSAIGAGRRLLVLDNFEHVVAAAPFVGELLVACPNLAVLATSRVALRLIGEHEYPVPPLDTGSEAVELFVDRARAVRPDFDPEESGEEVAELCRRLDGLPLAIELAAARTRAFSVHDLVSRLGKRLDLLQGGPVDRPARHQTLRQAIAWSLDLLNEDDQRAFRRLSVFRGGFDLDAAEALGASLDSLGTLVDHSLVHSRASVSGRARFSLLETIRAYGLELLEEAGEAEDARAAHASHFLALAERAEPELTGPEQGGWLERLEADHPNLGGALQWAADEGEAEIGLRLGAALWRFFLSRGHLAEGRRRLERALALPGAAAPSVARARALDGKATLEHNRGENAAARASLEESLAFWRERGDESRMAHTLANLGWVAAELTDLDAATALSEEALALHRKHGEKRGIAVALNNLGWVACYRGETREGRVRLEESLALRREIDDRRGVAFTMTTLAWVERLHCDFDRGNALLDEALALLEPLEDKLLTGFALMERSNIAVARGEWSDAAALLEQLERTARLWADAGNPSGLAWARTAFGEAEIGLGRFEEALAHLEESARGWDAVGGRSGAGFARLALGRALRGLGREAEARNAWTEALAIFVELRDRHGLAQVFEETAAGEIDPSAAARLLGRAEAIREALETPVPPGRRLEHGEVLARLRAELGEGLEPAFDEGRAGDWESAAESCRALLG
jgi:non-specific serine/threonine protein kinase